MACKQCQAHLHNIISLQKQIKISKDIEADLRKAKENQTKAIQNMQKVRQENVRLSGCLSRLDVDYADQKQKQDDGFKEMAETCIKGNKLMHGYDWDVALDLNHQIDYLCNISWTKQDVIDIILRRK